MFDFLSDDLVAQLSDHAQLASPDGLVLAALFATGAYVGSLALAERDTDKDSSPALRPRKKPCLQES